MSGGDFIAIDWGSTNRLVLVLGDDGQVRWSGRDDRGVLAVDRENFADELRELRNTHGDLPAIAAGMVTSSRGWVEVPYCDIPANLEAVAKGCITLRDSDVTLVPGLAQRLPGRADVMRGEEIQAFGAIAAGLAPPNGLFCQPGTHNKWIDIVDGRITGFSTAITGEIFALLRTQSLLADMLKSEVRDCLAFREGLKRGAAATDLLNALFEIRAAALLGQRDPGQSAAYASGLLIGADIGARTDLSGRAVYVLASGAMAELYGVAISALGGIVRPLDSEASFAAGIHCLRSMLR